MTDQMTSLALAAFALTGAAILTLAALKAWHGWLELRRLELTAAPGAVRETRGPAADRIEMADLKERIRKLESLAACIDP